ncbi:MAG: cupin domain-containing protein [candidate division KSB1 bacterium]|nr:cupin domain-containing protein [candidate division KSB1 bacterium]MDZ7347145.1 cupin domain-containing protein [candidate division KSB1 bacterium]
MQIRVERPSEEKLKELGVRQWPIWTRGVSEFPWSYDVTETCYILEGRAIITPDGGGDPVEIKAGDLVEFPCGLSCKWKIVEPIRKHYDFA